MHSCGNALTAAQERESAYVPTIPNPETLEKINLAQKQNISHLWLKAMHLCGNALTAAQERESAHVPFNMLGSWTKTTITREDGCFYRKWNKQTYKLK